MYVRRCESCGRLDLSERFESPESAEAAGIGHQPWECRECGGTSFELVEQEPETLA